MSASCCLVRGLQGNRGRPSVTGRVGDKHKVERFLLPGERNRGRPGGRSQVGCLLPPGERAPFFLIMLLEDTMLSMHHVMYLLPDVCGQQPTYV